MKTRQKAPIQNSILKSEWPNIFLYKLSFSLALGLLFGINCLQAALQPTPTEVSYTGLNYYTLTDNQFIDGEKQVLIYDSATDQDVDWDGRNIYVKGNIYFKAQNGETLSVHVGATTSSTYVAVQPFAKEIATLATANTLTPVAPSINSSGVTTSQIGITPRYAHLCFCPDVGGTVEVNLYRDLYLTGSNYSKDGARTVQGLDGSNAALSITPNDLVTDLTMTFTGGGQTVFKFANGKALIMDSARWDKDSGQHEFTNMRNGVNAGVRCFVAMDQDKDQVVTKGRNKIVFQRLEYNGGNVNCVVRVGRNSCLTYVSRNINGLDATQQSYASIAFDVSNSGEGRFELQITGSDVANTYVDGSLQINGCFLGYMNSSANIVDPVPTAPVNYENPFDFLGIDPDSTVNSFGKTTATGVDYSQPAGSMAFLRIIDKVAHSADSDYRDALNPVSGTVGVKTGGVNTRRGLLVVNNNFSIPPLANNPYGDAGWFALNGPNSNDINAILPYRPGFVLGVNGHIEVNHNTFLEYEALAPNIDLDLVTAQFTALDAKITAAGIANSNEILKKHNPSAFMVDGLETILRYEHPQTQATLSVPVSLIKFQAHLDPTIARHAEITLYGNASFTCRAPLLENQGVYDGFRVPVPDVLNAQNQIETFGETPGEGIYVMDIEGLFSIRSKNDSAVADSLAQGWHIGSGRAKSGTFRLGSLYRTSVDKEAKSHLVPVPEYIPRPLIIGQSYSRYDKPSILANASFDFIDLDFRNEDIARDIIADPNSSDPVILGGEKAAFQSVVELNANPDIAFWRVYNTTIHCHESMCITGARLLVREVPDYYLGVGQSNSNTSKIIFYNHGHALDTTKKGHGRIFMLGSNNNKFSNGSASPYLESAYANIFRHTGKSVSPLVVENFKNSDAVLKIQTLPEIIAPATVNEKSMHMFVLGNQSYVDVGWTSIEGIKQFDAPGGTVYPFDHVSINDVSQANRFIVKTTSTNNDGTSNPGEKPAEINLDGDFIFFGAKDTDGSGSPRTVDSFNLGRVIYVGHGGKMSIGSDLTVPGAPRPYIGFSDATIATRVWKNIDGERGLNPTLILPGDQMKLSNPIHPYDIDLNVLTDPLINRHLNLKALTGDTLGSEVRIAWNKIRLLPATPSLSGWEMSSLLDLDYGLDSRAIVLVNNPVTMPNQGLLQMNSGDFVDQISVSGATPANPFQFYMSGDNSGIALTREIASVSSDSLIPGEGDYAKIYLDGGAQLGLGTRHWNQQSLRAWNRLGLTQVTLHPNGDSKIAVNNDLIVVDPQPIVPTDKFGSQYQSAPNTQVKNISHRLTFYGQDVREVRIPAGKELDLSAFGKAKTLLAGDIVGTPDLLTPMIPGTQAIAMGGKTRIIFEAGSTLRFPDLGDVAIAPDAVAKMPILYINDETELVFEALQDLENKTPWISLADTNRARIKILGCGQIWINKHAKVSINDGALVGIEADSRTLNTNIIFSIQREGLLAIGDQINPGGSLQVGNPSNVSGAKIDFTLRLNGEESTAMIGRNGFLGFGAAAVNRVSSRINNWTIAPLFNVRNVNIRNIQGVFDHNRIFDGSDREASLMAIGPVSGQYSIELGPTNAVVRGGGNLLFVHSTPAVSPFTINIANQAQPLAATVGDNGKYSILSPSLTMKQVLSLPAGSQLDTLVANVGLIVTGDPGYTALQALALTKGDGDLLVGGRRLKAGQLDFYKYLSAGGYNHIKSQVPHSYAALGQTKYGERIGYVMNDVITRTPNFILQSGEKVSEGLILGALKVATSNDSQTPTSFVPPDQDA